MSYAKRPIAIMPRIDRDGFCLAAPVAITAVHGLPVNPPAGWALACVCSVVRSPHLRLEDRDALDVAAEDWWAVATHVDWAAS